MSRQDVSIPMPEGDARAYVLTPDTGTGPWPAVILFSDALAIRPVMFEMAQQLASHGYYVLLPDLHWRLPPYEPMNAKEVFGDPDKRQAFFAMVASSTNPQRATSDTGAFLDWLAKQPQAKAGKVGLTGYCMGGGIAIRAAGIFPERIAAAAAFHAGGMVTDQPDSPHVLAPKIKAKVFVGGADKDEFFTEQDFETLKKAFADAGVQGEVTIYRGALHGYAPSDSPVFNAEASERHWRDMLALFEETLK